MKLIYKSLAVAAVGLGMAANVVAAEFELKFQSVDESGNANYAIQKEWADSIETLTNGRVSIDLLPVGSVVKHTETLSAMSSGIIDGHLTATSYFSGVDPAFGLIANTVGAWSSTGQLLEFMYYGGGNELLEELYKPYGVQYVGASTTGVEAFVSTIPLKGVDDLKGLKLRAPEGLVQKVFAAAGAAPVNLPGSEVFTALSKGVIDAADYSVFSTNKKTGLHDIAKHPIQPGFHSLPLIDVSMNQKKWDSLPADVQAIFKMSVRHFAEDITTRLRRADDIAVKETASDVTIHNWPAEERQKFRAIAQGEWVKAAEASPNAKKVYDVLIAHLENSGLL